jgi:hypothetical protein
VRADKPLAEMAPIYNQIFIATVEEIRKRIENRASFAEYWSRVPDFYGLYENDYLTVTDVTVPSISVSALRSSASYGRTIFRISAKTAFLKSLEKADTTANAEGVGFAAVIARRDADNLPIFNIFIHYAGVSLAFVVEVESENNRPTLNKIFQVE